jgi:hypothetical protein
MARYSISNDDCLTWMDRHPENSCHAIVTDPPYGLKEYSSVEKEKLRNGKGGVWRIPPSFDGCRRSPLPRFTVLTEKDREKLRGFFLSFAQRAVRTLVPDDCGESSPLALSLSTAYGCRLREAGGDYPLGKDASRRRQAQECPQRVRGCDCYGEVLLGALGSLSKTLRGARPGQPPQVEDGRASTRIAPEAIRGCHTFRAHSARGTSGCAAPFSQTPSIHAADGSGLTSTGDWSRA